MESIKHRAAGNKDGLDLENTKRKGGVLHNCTIVLLKLHSHRTPSNHIISTL